MMTKPKKIILIVILTIVGLAFLLPVAAFCILRWIVFTPERLTPIVVEQANAYLSDARLKCDAVELTYFETYPYFGVKLVNGSLINLPSSPIETHDSIPAEELQSPCDTLVSFKRTIVAINPTYILNSKRIAIELFFIDTPRFYGYVNPLGKANWEVYQASTDTTTQTADTTHVALPPIDLKKVRIKDGRMVYNDRQQDVYAEVDGFFLNMRGSFSNQNQKNGLKMETGSSSILFDSPSYTLSNHLKLEFRSDLVWTHLMREITLKGAELKINDLPFKARGLFARGENGQPGQIDMAFNLDIQDLNEILKFVPDVYFKNKKQITTTGSILLEGKIKGAVGDSLVPSLDLRCLVDNGSYHIKGIQQGIDSLRVDVNLAFNGSHPDSSFVKVNELIVKGRNIAWDVKGSAYNLFKNPAIQARVKGNANLTQLAKDFLNPDTIALEGEIDADLVARFTINDLLDSKLNQIKAGGRLTIDRLKAVSPAFGLNAYIAGMRLVAGGVNRESRYMETNELLTSNLRIDTLNVRFKDQINSRISRLNLRVNTTQNMDTAAVVPVTTQLSINQLLSRLPDSTWVVLKNTTLEGGIKASASDKRTPTAGFRLRMDTLKYFLIPARTGAVLAGSQFTIEALPLHDAVKQRLEQMSRERRRALIRRMAVARQNRDSVNVAEVDTSGSSRLLRRWEARGQVRFDRLRLFSRYFPLPIHMDGTSVSFSTNQVTLKNAHLHLGKSDLLLNGNLSQLRSAFMRGGKLRGQLSVQSDLIDCNQLLLAMNRGSRFAKENAGSATSFNEDSLAVLEQENMEIAAGDTLRTDTTTQLLIIPKFLDLSLETNAKEIKFNDLDLNHVVGKVVVRDQALNLSELNMGSNIGNGNLTMVYSTPNEIRAAIGLELGLNQILVNKLIDLIPSIDSMVPMLRSFEGVLDCQITATCQTDSSMSILIPTLSASCSLRGENMVLLDGETFAEISKTLMFKNKKRNLIDSIAVDLAIQNNKLEIFPFLINMDRYRVAVGGTHNMDMTFDYHISVLKSPVPFKLGIDITGNLDDFKFRIVRCRYKDIMEPVRQAELDSTRRNIREMIRNEIRRQIEEAAPELGNSLSETHPFRLQNDVTDALNRRRRDDGITNFSF